MKKRLLLANFLREAGLFWARPVDNPQLAEAWYQQIKTYRAKAIESAMKEYFREEEYFPVPGTLIPRIKTKPNHLEPKEVSE
jgi:hypothetical protein